MRPVQLKNTMPLYLPYEKYKPFLNLKFSIEDFRFIMYKNNFIRNKLKDLVIFSFKNKTNERISLKYSCSFVLEK